MTRAKKLPLSEKHLGILLHSLGVQNRGGKWRKGGWRNHYSTNPGADSFIECKRLAEGGWMTRFSFTVCADNSEESIYMVTEAGIAALKLAGWRIEVAP